jgi:hypothetical protein
MNQKEQTPENPQRNARIMNAVRSRQWKWRLLTGVALGLGLLSIIAGIAIAWFSSYKIEPKQHELWLRYKDYEQKYQTATNTAANMAVHDTQMERDRRSLEKQHIFLTHVVGLETMLIALAVALVGIGTVVTIVLVMVTRRVTLRQINESLVQISNQIRELENRTG